MKLVKLLHNPGAGDEGHDEKELVALIEANSFECSYASVKKKIWTNFEPEPDFLVVAGGDGTVRKITKELFEQNLINKKWPIALLPLGTANNIATTLGIKGKIEDIIQSWHKGKLKKYDVGTLDHIDQTHFFLESFGYGIFPYMMMEMKRRGKEEIGEPKEKIKSAVKLLHEITLSYEPRLCRLQIDGTDHSGKFLLAEIMNTPSIGPNLILAPDAATDDGKLDVVLVAEKDKNKFVDYLLSKLNNAEEAYPFAGIKAKQIKISWDGTHVHTDDKVIKVEKNAAITIELKEGLLEFLVS